MNLPPNRLKLLCVLTLIIDCAVPAFSISIQHLSDSTFFIKSIFFPVFRAFCQISPFADKCSKKRLLSVKSSITVYFHRHGTDFECLTDIWLKQKHALSIKLIMNHACFRSKTGFYPGIFESVIQTASLRLLPDHPFE